MEQVKNMEYLEEMRNVDERRERDSKQCGARGNTGVLNTCKSTCICSVEFHRLSPRVFNIYLTIQFYQQPTIL